jgi:trk system potassium uptake protein TrkH
LMFGVLEHRTLTRMPSVVDHLLIPLFQSVTCRTAGFNTVDIGSLHDATLMMIFFMFFGAEKTGGQRLCSLKV